MNISIAELIAHLVIIAAPLLVVVTIGNGAAITPVSPRVRPGRALVVSTAILAAIVVLIDLGRPHPLAGMIFSCISFVVLFFSATMPALQRVESEARRHHTSDPGALRSASLTPRGAGDILRPAVRLLSPAVLVAAAPIALLIVSGSAIARPHLVLGTGFFAAATIFYVLYEKWIRDEGRGVEREGRLRAIARWQAVLVVTFAILSLAVFFASSTIMLAAGVALGGPIGIAGCAYAVLSGSSPTRFRRVPGDRDAGSEDHAS